MRAQLRSLAVAAVAAAAMFAWQFATVHANYEGNWTALFCIGGNFRRPPELNDGVYVFPNSPGYDGQWYRAVAHDPWMRAGLWRFVDMRERCYRILLPAAAWLLAFGRPEWVDRAYVLAALLFLFAGVWVVAAWSADQKRSEWWGLGFALLPGTLITMDRMTVDVAEYAFMAGGLYCWRRRWWAGCWICGAAAFLTRELGLLAIAAMAAAALVERSWKRALAFGSAAIPALLWNAYVTAIAGKAHLVPRWVARANFIGTFQEIFNPRTYPGLPPVVETATRFLDALAVAGVVMAICLALAGLRRRALTVESIFCALYTVVFLMVSNKRFWADPYSYQRAFSPLAGLLGWRGLTEERPWMAIPLLVMLARVVWQLGPQALGILGVR